MKLDEIASRIKAHLKRFEADPTINKRDKTYRLTPYYWPGAYRAGSKVAVCYVSFHGASKLTKAEAEAYLAWLDAGNVGKHYSVPKTA
jgi:hypothetical protein